MVALVLRATALRILASLGPTARQALA